MSTDKDADSDLPLPKGWIKTTSKKFKKPYYYHEKTKCSIWVHPALLYPKETEKDDGSESLVRTTTSEISNSYHEECTSSKYERRLSTFKNSAGPSSPETDQTQVSGEFHNATGRGLISTKKHSLKLLDKKASSLIGKVKSSNVLDTQIENYGKHIVNKKDNKEDKKDVNKKGTLVDIDKKHWSNLIGYQSSKKLKNTEKTVTKKNHSLRNHPYSKTDNEFTSKSSDYYTVNVASTNQTFISTTKNKTIENVVCYPVKPTLKPSPSPDVRKTCKRISSEEVESLTSTPELQKVKKSNGKERKRDTHGPSLKEILHKESINFADKSVSKKTMTPAMRAVLNRRGLHLIKPRERSDVEDENESNVLSTKERNETSPSEESSERKKKDSKPNAAMIAMRRKIEERKKKEKLVEENNITENLTNEKKNEESTQNKEQGLVSKIWDKCVSFRKKLKPMRPSTKLKAQQISAQQISHHKSFKQPNHLPEKKTDPPKQNFDSVEDMDIDDFEISEGIRNFREDVNFANPQADSEESLPTYSHPLFIVVDTNVLLSNLNFVIELKDYPVHGIGLPVLMIPWIVFQELDSLKDSVKRYHHQKNRDGSERYHDLSVLARKAINSIGKCLDGEHPRVKGQSIMEASINIEGFKKINNDDSIIHCALGLKVRAPKSNIVVLSNDRNLCNKSIVVGIKAFSNSNILNSLKKMANDGSFIDLKTNANKLVSQMNLDVPIRPTIRSSTLTSIPSYSPPPNQSNKSNNNGKKTSTAAEIEKTRNDYIFCEVQYALRDIFAKIIETEMIEAYDKDLWLAIVKIKPPWVLDNTLVLFEKHWIAVFGNLVDRDLKGTILKLQDIHSDLKSCRLKITSLKRMLQVGLEILLSFQKHSKYDGLVPKTIKKLQSYLDELNGKSTGHKDLNQCSTSTKISNQTSSKTFQETDSGASSQQGSSKQFSSYENVRLTLDQIWNTSTHYSGLVFASLKFPSPLIEQISSEETIPSTEESMLCLSVMIPCILSLVKSIHNLLTNTDTLEPQALIMSLFQSMHAFIKDVMKQECSLQPDDLFLFCQDSNNKEIFVQGFTQLDQLYGTLKHCEELMRAGG